MIRLNTIDHTCLIVPDLVESVNGFQSIFGGTFTPRDNDPATIAAEIGNVHFFISQNTAAPEEFLRLQHISFQVDSLDYVREKLTERSIAHTTGTVLCFTQNNYHWCEWRDSHGIRIECVELIANYPESVRESLALLDSFSEAFVAEDPVAMDQTLHFPHLLISSGQTLLWEKPGMIPVTFFDDLRATGWAYTILMERTPILIQSDKVTYRYCYSRNRADGSIISTHQNIWIVEKRNDRWGISVRSY